MRRANEQEVIPNLMNAKWIGAVEEGSLEYLKGEDNGEVPAFKIVTLFGGDLLSRLYVIAERTENGIHGRVKRGLNAQFTEQERAVLSRWRVRIRAWLLLTGVPHNGVRMSAGTYGTLVKFADFFASV